MESSSLGLAAQDQKLVSYRGVLEQQMTSRLQQSHRKANPETEVATHTAECEENPTEAQNLTTG